MDNAAKWYFICVAIFMSAMFIALGFGDMDSEDTKKYEACIKYHSPEECEDVR